MKVYLAGSIDKKEIIENVAHRLHKNDMIIALDWWSVYESQNEKIKNMDKYERKVELMRIADIDYNAIRKSDVVVVVYSDKLRGAYMEAGFALALNKSVIFYDGEPDGAMPSHCYVAEDMNDLLAMLFKLNTDY